VKCPNCTTEIEIQTVDVCNHGSDGGIDVFFDCPVCLKSFGAVVPPDAFAEFNPDED
jgi:hypothetical protein